MLHLRVADRPEDRIKFIQHIQGSIGTMENTTKDNIHAMLLSENFNFLRQDEATRGALADLLNQLAT